MNKQEINPRSDLREIKTQQDRNLILKVFKTLSIQLVGSIITRLEFVEGDVAQIAHRYHSGNFVFVEATKPDGTTTGFSVVDGSDPVNESGITVFDYISTVKMFKENGLAGFKDKEE